MQRLVLNPLPDLPVLLLEGRRGVLWILDAATGEVLVENGEFCGGPCGKFDALSDVSEDGEVIVASGQFVYMLDAADGRLAGLRGGTGGGRELGLGGWRGALGGLLME